MLSQMKLQLVRLDEQIKLCNQCSLRRGAIQTVPGNGVYDTHIMFIGEAPGRDEDRTGLPFVGKSGKLLRDTMSDFGIDPETVLITNVVKCRPPGNRTPCRLEVLWCIKWLYAQINAVRPYLIVAVGGTALSTLTDVQNGVSKSHGNFFKTIDIYWHRYNLYSMYHPSAVLRDPELKSVFTADMERLSTWIKQGERI